jgi:hypothetical protein
MSDPANDDLGLPLELLTAVTEFTAWPQAQLLAEQSASTPTEPLYHYTREPSLRGVLGGQKMWCFSHEHQSDPTEFECGSPLRNRSFRKLDSRTTLQEEFRRVSPGSARHQQALRAV